MHGGSSPQVRKKAEERLRELVDPSIDVLSALLKARQDPRVRLQAAKDVLDRTGHGTRRQFEIGIGGDVAMTTESYDEPNLETLNAGDQERLTKLTERFEAGRLLTRKEQLELHSLRSQAGRKSWLRISTGAATVFLPSNGRGD